MMAGTSSTSSSWMLRISRAFAILVALGLLELVLKVPWHFLNDCSRAVVTDKVMSKQTRRSSTLARPARDWRTDHNKKSPSTLSSLQGGTTEGDGCCSSSDKTRPMPDSSSFLP